MQPPNKSLQPTFDPLLSLATPARRIASNAAELKR